MRSLLSGILFVFISLSIQAACPTELTALLSTRNKMAFEKNGRITLILENDGNATGSKFLKALDSADINSVFAATLENPPKNTLLKAPRFLKKLKKISAKKIVLASALLWIAMGFGFKFDRSDLPVSYQNSIAQAEQVYNKISPYWILGTVGFTFFAPIFFGKIKDEDSDEGVIDHALGSIDRAMARIDDALDKTGKTMDMVGDIVTGNWGSVKDAIKGDAETNASPLSMISSKIPISKFQLENKEKRNFKEWVITLLDRLHSNRNRLIWAYPSISFAYEIENSFIGQESLLKDFELFDERYMPYTIAYALIFVGIPWAAFKYLPMKQWVSDIEMQLNRKRIGAFQSVLASLNRDINILVIDREHTEKLKESLRQDGWLTFKKPKSLPKAESR